MVLLLLFKRGKNRSQALSNLQLSLWTNCSKKFYETSSRRWFSDSSNHSSRNRDDSNLDFCCSRREDRLKTKTKTSIILRYIDIIQHVINNLYITEKRRPPLQCLFNQMTVIIDNATVIMEYHSVRYKRISYFMYYRIQEIFIFITYTAQRLKW